MKGLYLILSHGIVGAVCGFAAWRYAKEKYLKKADEEIASVTEYYEDKFKKVKEQADAAEKNAKDKEESANAYKAALIKFSAENAQQYVKAAKEKSEGQIKREKDEDSDESEDHPRDDEDYHEIDDTDEYVEDYLGAVRPRYSKPEIITEDQWAEELCGVFDKVALEYYPEDDILVTEDGELMDNLIYSVGLEWKTQKGPFKVDDEVFVRNESTGTDYMITVCAGLGGDHISVEE